MFWALIILLIAVAVLICALVLKWEDWIVTVSAIVAVVCALIFFLH